MPPRIIEPTRAELLDILDQLEMAVRRMASDLATPGYCRMLLHRCANLLLEPLLLAERRGGEADAL